MKRSFLVLFILVMFSMTVSPAGINVTSPNAASKWDVGQTYNITWNSPNCPGGQVKINIFKNSIVQSNFVEQLVVPNTGLKGWKVPNSYAAGNYQIRIKSATDNDCVGDSAVFEIKGLQAITTIMIPKENIKTPVSTPHNIPLIQFPDFHIYKLTLIADNSLVILYENLGSPYQGPLEMRYKIKGIETVVTRNVHLGGNLSREAFPTGRVLTVADLSDNGRSVGIWATVDPNNKIGELKKTNNSLYQTVYPELGIPDYIPNDLTFEVVRRSNQPRKLPYGHIKVRVKNIGSSYNGFVVVAVTYRFEGESGFPHSMPQETFPLDLNSNQQKWLKLQYIHWPITSSTTKDLVNFRATIIPAPGNPEIITSNNEYIRGFLHPDGPF